MYAGVCARLDMLVCHAGLAYLVSSDLNCL